MKTLREWNGDSNELILSFLKEFGIKAEKITILQYEALTPDSFIWIFNTDSGRYCLYAEDHVPSIDHVKKQINEKRSEWNPEDQYELLRVSHNQEWDKASPVATATTYQPPEKQACTSLELDTTIPLRVGGRSKIHLELTKDIRMQVQTR